MRKTKALFALATATTLLFSSMTVFAGGTIDGTGELEDYVDKEVFSLVAPVVSDVDFTLDPQGLLYIADSTTYKLGEGAVYFANHTYGADGNATANGYSDTSDAITIGNKSSYGVNVSLEVTVEAGEEFTFVDSEDALADATTPSIYLGLICDSDDAVAVTADGLKPEAATLTAVPEVTSDSDKGYMITATSDGEGGYTYSYDLTSAFTDADADTVSYTLTAACDSTADWSAIKEDAKTATVSIIWDVESAEDAAVEGICLLVNSTFWVGPDASDNTVKFADDVTVSDVKVNGLACEYAMKDGYIAITWAQVQAAGAGESDVTSWTVTCTVDGENYTATYSL